MLSTTVTDAAHKGALMKLDPSEIARTQFPNRDENGQDEAKVLELRKSIRSAGGNVEPIKVRVRPGTGEGEGNPLVHECVYGHRRMDACASLGLPVLAVVVDDMDDKALLIERIAENRGRSEYTALEQGRICLAALNAGHFRTQAALADDLGLDESQVSKALELARLPAEVLAAFVSSSELTYRDAKPLSDAVKANRHEVVQKAKAIAAMDPRPSTKEVIKVLTEASHSKRVEQFKTFTLTVDNEPFGQLQLNSKKLLVTFIDDSFNDAHAFRKAIESCYDRLRKKRAKALLRESKGG